MYRYNLSIGDRITSFASLWNAAAYARELVMYKNEKLVASDIFMTFLENAGSTYTFQCAGGDEATLTRVFTSMAEGYGNDPTYNGSEAALGLQSLLIDPMEGNNYGLRRMSCYESWNIFELVDNHTGNMVMRYAPDMPALVVDTKGGSQAGLQETLDCINTGLRIFAEKRYPMLGSFPELYTAGEDSSAVLGFICGRHLKLDSKHSRLLILPQQGKFMLD